MCGIGGVISQNKQFRNSAIQIIKNEIGHRGPDFSKNFNHNHFTFTHSLLKIMDLQLKI